MSEHPLATHATGEVVGELLEALGPEPDLAIVFVTAAHLGALDDVAAAVRATLGPRTLIGATAVSVLGGGREVEEQPAITLWAARSGAADHPDGGDAGDPGDRSVRPVRIDRSGVWSVPAGPDGAPAPGSTLVLLSDPGTFAGSSALDEIARVGRDITVVGGPASAPTGPGGNRLALDDAMHTDGAVGMLLGPGWPIRSVTSQAARPIGDPFTVTRAEGSLVLELAGRAAMTRLREVVDQLPPAERALASRSLHLGRVIDDHKPELDRGDFLIRTVRGADPETGAIAVDDEVDLGATVQFQVRDPVTADDALVFAGTGRGTQLFGLSDHDAELLADLGHPRPAVAGLFTATPYGPVGPRSFVHPDLACVALLGWDR
jgi:small ligand-binding sensory domain FIST